MIVTIDGPAGAGKSSVARLLAERLGFRFLDTGAMYRAVTWAALERQIDLADVPTLAKFAQSLDLTIRGDRVLVEGRDVTGEIRTSAITKQIFHAAGNAGVRSRLVDLQRQVAAGQNVVTEGRDQGTVAFPDAQCKIFLTASAEERARRRQLDLASRGEEIAWEVVLADQNERDRRDENREVGPLRRAPDAIEFRTDGLDQEEVVAQLVTFVQSRQPS